MKTDIKTQLSGKWSSVLQSIGMEHTIFNGKHQPCIYCGGKDRARWDKAKEFYICGQCGPRQPIEMAMDYLNLSFKETAFYLRPNLDKYKMTTISAPDTTANEARIKQIHAGLKRITPDCLAAKYLAGRGITVLPERDCYFHPGIAYYEDGKKIGVHPCMVSVFRDNNGDTCTYHLTYLTQTGEKLHCESPKKILPTIRPLSGSAIKLFAADDTLCIAEGIETALAIYQRNGLPIWAAGNANNMAAMLIPDNIKHIYIYADEDKNFCGARSAYDLANKLTVKGNRETVKVIRLIDRVETVDSGDKFDYLDYLLEQTNGFIGTVVDAFGQPSFVKTQILGNH